MALNKKGSARDLIIIIVLFFLFGSGFFVMNYFTNTVTDAMIQNPVINQTNESVDALNETKDLTARYDYIGFVILISLLLSFAIIGYFIGGNKIFMFLYFIFIIIAIVVSMILSNVWDIFTNMTIFGTTINAFPLTNHIISNFAIYAAIFGFIGIIAMFGKAFSEGF